MVIRTRAPTFLLNTEFPLKRRIERVIDNRNRFYRRNTHTIDRPTDKKRTG